MEQPQNKKEEYFQTIQEYLIKMPSLSTTISKVLSVCNSPNTSANDLNKVIAMDPVLTGNVLKLINSAYYALRRKVNSLTQAIIMLGLNNIKNLALSTAVLGNITKKKSPKDNTMDIFWTHCVATGVWAKALALETGITKSKCEEYFVAGLLHDIGKIPLIHCYPENYVKIIDTANEKNLSIYTLEKRIFGLDHEEIGKLIGQKWKLEGPIFQTICNHHHLSSADEQTHDFVERLMVSDTLSRVMIDELDENEDGQNDIFVQIILQNSLVKDFLEKYDLTVSTLKNIQATTQTEIENAKSFMQIAKG